MTETLNWTPEPRLPLADVILGERWYAASMGADPRLVTPANARRLAEIRVGADGRRTTHNAAEYRQALRPRTTADVKRDQGREMEAALGPIGRPHGNTGPGKRSTHSIFGHSHTAFFLWAGANGWTPAEVQAALNALKLPEVSILSIRTFLYAGRKGATKQLNGRADIPAYAAEEIAQLNAAGGRPEPKPQTKKSKKGAK